MRSFVPDTSDTLSRYHLLVLAAIVTGIVGAAVSMGVCPDAACETVTAKAATSRMTPMRGSSASGAEFYIAPLQTPFLAELPSAYRDVPYSDGATEIIFST